MAFRQVSCSLGADKRERASLFLRSRRVLPLCGSACPSPMCGTRWRRLPWRPRIRWLRLLTGTVFACPIEALIAGAVLALPVQAALVMTVGAFLEFVAARGL